MKVSAFKEVNGVEAPPPVAASVTCCDENADRVAERAQKYIGGNFKTVVKHYEVEAVCDLQVWGAPEQCYEKVMELRRRTGTRHLANNFCFAGMPFDQANHSMERFASEMVPELQKLDA